MKYQGHKNWNHWNVSLWLNNDECLYTCMRHTVNRSSNRQQAAKYLLESLNECGIFETPDGAKYSVSSIRGAMVGL